MELHEGQDESGLPTTTQTITFIKNVQAGMSVRYERAKTPKQSAAAKAGTPATNKQTSW